MSNENNRVTPEKVYVEKVDGSGAGWAVAMIVLVMAIGFGFLAFSNQQTTHQMKLEQAYDNLRDESIAAKTPGESSVNIQVPEVKVPEVKMPDVDLPEVNISTDNGGEQSAPAADTNNG